MMTTLLDLLSTLGQATWQAVWMPILAWTLIVLPFWALLERTDRLHPHAEYRLYQVLLAALPVGMLATALFDGRWTSTVGMSSTGLSVVVMPPVEPTVQSTAVAPSLTWLHAVGLVTVAALGMSVVGLSRLVFDAIALIHVRADIDDGSPSADSQTIADRLARRLGVTRPVRIRTTPDAAVPLTLGGLSPTVLLPPSLLDRSEALHMTLAHELVHVRRYDDLSHLIERSLGALFAAHPLVGRLTNRIAEARERACDTAVLADADPSPPAYARLLATFADERPPQIDTLTLSESPSSLTTRLRAMQSSVSRWFSSRVSLVAVLLITGIIVTFGVVACSDSVSPSATPSDASSSPQEAVRAKKAQTPPFLKGGMTALQQEIQYPDVAREAGIQGQVFVQFVVDASGQPQQVHVKEGVHEALDSAAVKAVRSVAFEPGVKDGNTVPVEMSLPITFRLPEDSTSTTTSDASNAATARLLAIVHHDPPETKDRPGSAFTKTTAASLNEKMYYPDLVRKAGITGTVEVTFTLNESGNAQDPRITQSVHEALDTAALQSVRNTQFVAKAPKKWNPVGEKLSVRFVAGSPTDAS